MRKKIKIATRHTEWDRERERDWYCWFEKMRNHSHSIQKWCGFRMLWIKIVFISFNQRLSLVCVRANALCFFFLSQRNVCMQKYFTELTWNLGVLDAVWDFVSNFKIAILCCCTAWHVVTMHLPSNWLDEVSTYFHFRMPGTWYLFIACSSDFFRFTLLEMMIWVCAIDMDCKI